MTAPRDSSGPDNRVTAMLLLPTTLWFLLLLVMPLVVIAVFSLGERAPAGGYQPALTLAQYANLPARLKAFTNTLTLAPLGTLLCVLMAYPLAYFLVFKIRNNQLRAALYMAVIVPLWVSYLLRAYTWKTILGREGILNSFLVWTGILDKPTDIFLYNQFSMVVTLTYIFVPFMVMPIYTALEKIPRSMIEASKDLGVGPIRTFLRVTLPLSMPGVIAGATFTICLTFGDFVAAFLVGGPNGAMIATIIQSQFGATLNWPLGAALSIVVLVIVLTIVSLSDRLERVGRIDLD